MKSILGLFCCILILTGCSSNPPIEITDGSKAVNWAEHFAAVKTLTKWNANAKVAIKVKQKTQSAKMHWQQQDESYKIEFSGPFGHAGPLLTGNGKSATLQIPKEAPIKGPNTSNLLQQRLGWQLPVENAKYWILGIPSPLSESKVTLKDEKLAVLQQDGWNINYAKYQTVGDRQLPSKIIITRDDFRFLLIIYKWDTNEAIVKS